MLARRAGSGEQALQGDVVHGRAQRSSAGAAAPALARAAGISGSLITFGNTAAQDIDFISAHLNGVPLSFVKSSSAGVPEARERGFPSSSPFAAGAPLLLTATGLAGDGLAAGTAIAASCGGTLTITPAIPEPGTCALLLTCLATVAWVARRRQP